MLLRSSFASFGFRSTFVPPIRIDGVGGIAVGREVFIGANCWLHGSDTPAGPALRIGDRVSISGDVTLSAASRVEIGDGCLIARGVYISDHRHRFEGNGAVRDQGTTEPADVVIGEGSWIAQGVVVLPGVHIGAGSVIAANSVVATDVPSRSVAAGTPARVVKTF